MVNNTALDTLAARRADKRPLDGNEEKTLPPGPSRRGLPADIVSKPKRLASQDDLADRR